jgi:chemotaxis protein CheD
VGASAVAADGLLVTHALGSCLGLVLWDPIAKVGGLLHAMLPLAATNPRKAAVNPAMFVETGVPAMLDAICTLGARRPNLMAKAAGCASPLRDGSSFRIGQRNLQVLEQILAKENLRLTSRDVGGHGSRTLTFEVETGEVWLSSGARKWKL